MPAIFIKPGMIGWQTTRRERKGGDLCGAEGSSKSEPRGVGWLRGSRAASGAAIGTWGGEGEQQRVGDRSHEGRGSRGAMGGIEYRHRGRRREIRVEGLRGCMEPPSQGAQGARATGAKGVGAYCRARWWHKTRAPPGLGLGASTGIGWQADVDVNE